MKVKRLLAAAITAFVALTSVLPVSAIDYGKEYENKPSGTYDVKFKDVPRNNWAFEYIGEMQKRGIINGYPDGKYYPDNYVERCEFAKIMVGAAGLRTGDASGEYFADVKYNDWFYEYVETAKEYLTGYKSFGQNYFRPNNYALREDIAVALVKLKGYDTKNTDQNILQTMFSDYDSISESAKPYVATAVDRGLVSGYDDGTFKGQDSITRAEAAAMLWRAYQYGNDNKTTEVSDNSNNSQTLGDADNNKTDDTKNDKKTDTNTDKKTDTKKNANNTLTESKDDGKSYAVTTLAKATINDSLTDMTIDDNDTVYYINRKDNSLYKVAAKSGAGAKKLTSLSKLTYTETETRQETRTVKKKVEKVSSQSADEGAAIALAAVEDEDKSNDTTVTNNNESDKDDVTLDNGEMADDDKKDENLGEEDKDNQNGTDDKKESDSKDSTDSDKSDSKDENTDKDTNKDADKDKDSEKPKEPEYEYIDVEETVDVEVPIAKYSDYYAQQIYYEPTSDKVWLIGYFKNKTNEQGQEGSDKFWMTLNANDLKEVIVKGSFEPDSGEPVIGSLPNGQIVTKYGNYRIYLINQDTWQRREFYIGNYANIWSAIQNGNNLFMLDSAYDKLYTYNFTSKSCDEYKTEFELTADKMASGNNSFYFWDISGGKIVSFNVKTEKFKTFNIDAEKDIQLKDGGYITANGLTMMRVTSNENFVFADKDSAAIRLLYKK
jgi:hypothetical protein